MARAITRMSFEIIERNRGIEDLCVIGILRRGAVIAERIAAKIAEVEGRSAPESWTSPLPGRPSPGGRARQD